MKQPTTLRAFTALAALFFALATRAEFPVIKSIEIGDTNLIVTASVPPGHARILLECRDQLRANAWIPVAVKRTGGQRGEIAFHLPRTTSFAFFRVRADVSEPLPASFYTGANAFDAQPVFSSGSWPVYVGWPIYTIDTSGFQLFSLASPTASAMNGSPVVAPAESRAVVESDIWRLDGDTLYFFNQNRGLQIIDITNPDSATLRGMLNLPAAGEQMYLLPPNHVVLLTRTSCNPDNGQVLIVAVSNGVPAIAANLSMGGSIIESRLVGKVLYVATRTARPVSGSGGAAWETGTQIQSFDLAVPNAPIARSTLWYSGNGNVVHSTDTYFFAVTTEPTNAQRSIVNAIDITSHDGTMNAHTSITAAGQVADKFKLAWNDNVFSVISEVTSAPRVTKLETFRLPDPRSLSPLAPLKLGEVELGHGERLFATRFDGKRAYVVTFLQVDPLWVVDLNDPEHPSVSGELQVPGWSTYIHPLGDCLVAVGTENGGTTVSLFDVSNPSHPALLSRAPLGQYSTSEANSDEKAFTVLEDAGLILLPVSGYTTNGYRSWVQLLDLGTNSLTARGVIERALVPRRATLHHDRIVSLSAAELLSVDATDRDHPQVSGQLALAWPVNRVFVAGDYLIEVTTANHWDVSSASVVRVASLLDPSRALTTLTFTNASIAGATVRSNRLYVVQINGYEPTLSLTVMDLSALPSLNVLGQASAAASFLGRNSELEPVWPKLDVLVWESRGNDYDWGWNRPWNIVSPGVTISIGAFWSYPIRAGNNGRLFAFDVSSDSAPAFLSEVNFAGTGGWNFTKPFAAGGLVYLSHQTEVADPNTTSPTNLTIISWPLTRFERSFLDVVDYADARHPALRPPVNIPGTLHGLSHDGALLYTVGIQGASTNGYEGENALQASAYDGVSAYLVDSVSLSNTAPPPVLVSGTSVFLGRVSGTTNSVPPKLETWTLSSAGKFTNLGSVTLPDAASDLVLFPGLLAASLDGTRVLVFDDSDPAALRQIGEGPATGCLQFNLRRGDTRAGELWLPLDDYGVTRVELSP